MKMEMEWGERIKRSADILLGCHRRKQLGGPWRHQPVRGASTAFWNDHLISRMVWQVTC